MPTENVTRWGRSKPVRLFGLGAVVACGVAALMVVPDLLVALSRPLRRQLIDSFLQTLRMSYSVTLAIALPGVLILATLVLNARRLRERRPRLVRMLLLSTSCLFGLTMLEGAAAAWHAWVHHLPSLHDQLHAKSLQLPDKKPGRAPEAPGAPALPLRFEEAPGDPVYVVVIGESSAEGFPYQPCVSVGQIVVWQLERANPERRFELDILAQGGADLEMMHRKLSRLKRRPDAMIIYCGHNEFQARYPWSRTLRPPELPRAPRLDLFERIVNGSPLCRMIDEAIDTNRVDAPPPLVARPLLDGPLCSAAEYAAILADFRRRLEAIVASCGRLGTLPILVIPPANESGFEPSRTVLPGPLSPDERAALTREFQAARAAEDNPACGVARYRALVARQPAFAEAHFRLARLLEQAGDWVEARRHYVLARDADGLPIRLPTVFQDAYREVAARHDCILIDGPEVLRAQAAHGILDDTMFHDAHHPSLRGQAILAEAILRALRARRAFGWSDGPEPAVEPAECATHFGVDARRWWLVCERSDEFYRNIAVTRHDPRERLAKSRRLARAAAQIAGGMAPEATGYPGLGCAASSRPVH
jgi:hypothetical protein